jgi:hypothetical protein
MAALGCLLPFLLLLLGCGIGGVIGGTMAAIWGGVAGFAIGLLGALLALRIFQGARDGLRE